MTKNVENHGDCPDNDKDCGCGCAGAGDCNETNTEPKTQARRALMLGAAGSAAFLGTLVNRRAFADGGGAQCGPISHAGSLNHSVHPDQLQCGGATPGGWKNHAACVASTLKSINSSFTAAGTTLAQACPAVGSADSTAGSTTFKGGLCDPSSTANHWATAILNAASPGINPNYPYKTVAELNTAISNALAKGVSGQTILTALETQENDFGVSGWPCSQSSLC